MNGYMYYGTSGLQVLPYMPGVPVYTDAMLPFLYQKTKEEGKLDSVFCGDVFNQDAFVNFFYTRKTMQILAEIEENKTIKPVGYAWVDLPKGVDGARSAHCGFCFFNGASERNSARDLGRLGIAYWLIDLKINVLHGVLLESNVAAKNFALKVGFTEVAVVPSYHYHNGALEGARVMVLKDTDFLPEWEKWRSENPVASTE